MFVTKRNNEIESVKFDKITERISKLINEGENLDPVLIAQKVVASIFPGISTEELDLESANICVNLSTTNYLYSNLAGRILVSNLHKKLFNLKDNQDFPTNFVDKQNLIQSKLNLLDITYLEYINNNKDDINNIIDYNRDYLFDYFGFKTLEKAYLMKIGNKIIETPQDMFLRVACFINMNNIEQIKKTYDLMSNGFYTHASPTLFNAGNKRSQLASCFLLGTEDSIEGITKTWASVSKISKWGGGIGLHVSNIRAKNSLIRGTNGPSNGLIPMLKVYNEIARYIDQGGKRKGSIAIYLEPHHPDIMAFLDLRKNFGTETERARDLFTAVWVSDLFMTLVHEDKDWYLLCPDACPGLSDAYGKKYEELYWSYVYQKKYNSKIKAREVMKAILDSQLETGTPYIGYKDHINRKSNQKNIGTIKSSNLCHEIVQYSSENEYAVCNLASIAINKCVENKNIEGSWTIYVKDNCKYCTWAKKYLESKGYTYNIKTNLNELQISDKNKLTYPQIFLDNEYIGGWNELFNYIKCSFNYNKLYEVAYQATKNLNNIIDLNYYPVIEAKISNIRHRPIGLGIQGLADTLVLLKTPFDSEEAIDFNSKMMETIYLAALTASKDISKERMEDMKLLIKQFYFDSEINFPEFYDPNYDKNNILYHKIKPSIYELQSNDSENFPSYCGAY
jgi:ribonucleoside-diphosphate reductase subunit M1